MNVLAALVLTVGTGCHLAEPKGICANGVWLASVATATLAILASRDHRKVLVWLTLLSVLTMVLFVEFSLTKLLKEVRSWPEE